MATPGPDKTRAQPRVQNVGGSWTNSSLRSNAPASLATRASRPGFVYGSSLPSSRRRASSRGRPGSRAARTRPAASSARIASRMRRSPRRSGSGRSSNAAQARAGHVTECRASPPPACQSRAKKNLSRSPPPFEARKRRASGGPSGARSPRCPSTPMNACLIVVLRSFARLLARSSSSRAAADGVVLAPRLRSPPLLGGTRNVRSGTLGAGRPALG